MLWSFTIGALVVFGAALIVAMVLVATPMPAIDRPADVFGFGDREHKERSSRPQPALERFTARDGSTLAFRVYDSNAETILLFVHGSSYHGGGYHDLAASIATSGAARVVLPNLRGHYLSGVRRGDVDYIGQLEDDVADLIGVLRERGHHGRIYIGGHSSGGGFAIRFGAGPHGALASGLVLVAPIIPTAPSTRGGDAGGWAVLNQRRLFGLIALGVVGIHGFDGLPVIQFNKPAEFWDGTETLSYTYRLNVSYHPRYPFERDLARLGENIFVLVGASDESIDADALKTLFAQHAPQAQFLIAPGLNHFGSFVSPNAHRAIAEWLVAQGAVPAQLRVQ